jgi:hypothetical protein
MAIKVCFPSSKAVPYYMKHFNVQYLEHLYDLVEEIPLNLKMTDMDSNSGEISPEQLLKPLMSLRFCQGSHVTNISAH